MILLEGLALGFAYAMPIGSQNIFVIHSALNQGLPRSYWTAGVVTAMDVSLSLACFYGIGVLLEPFPILRLALIGIGALYLLYIGGNLLAKKPDEISSEGNAKTLPLKKIVAMGFVLTWANPQALIDGTVLFGGFRSSLQPNDVIFFVIGMTLASVLWFFFLTSLVGFFRKAMNVKILYSIQVVCGAILVVLGSRMAMEFLRRL